MIDLLTKEEHLKLNEFVLRRQGCTYGELNQQGKMDAQLLLNIEELRSEIFGLDSRLKLVEKKSGNDFEAKFKSELDLEKDWIPAINRAFKDSGLAGELRMNPNGSVYAHFDTGTVVCVKI